MAEIIEPQGTPQESTWVAGFDERQQKEIWFSRIYDSPDFRHGTDGHNSKLIISKMANKLDETERQQDLLAGALTMIAEQGCYDPFSDPNFKPEPGAAYSACSAVRQTHEGLCPAHLAQNALRAVNIEVAVR